MKGGEGDDGEVNEGERSERGERVSLVWCVMVWVLVANSVHGDLVSVNSREVTRALVESMAKLTDTMLYQRSIHSDSVGRR